ncbi:hypothetical protein TGFOU_365910 [Toxoplasma gondii FOU]|uniref:Uncharacterized protein n=3 Tax=Toxoplasma gondii TaxID=5811 RepID=A0A086LF82_TOXGO|nr:hypothetical protein TGFOU_365910 [Toxoplasma gondii FOU]PUA92642.1 exonuclease [Toxoplasma gondii TgCATBr9]RQX75780.1 hypothetical protein TGCAST_365910 [Toxoplasma gondii CAST]
MRRRAFPLRRMWPSATKSSGVHTVDAGTSQTPNLRCRLFGTSGVGRSGKWRETRGRPDVFFFAVSGSRLNECFCEGRAEKATNRRRYTAVFPSNSMLRPEWRAHAAGCRLACLPFFPELTASRIGESALSGTSREQGNGDVDREFLLVYRRPRLVDFVCVANR